MSKKQNSSSFSSDYKKLEELLDWFDGNEFDLDQAEKKFAEAQVVIKKLKTRLKTAKQSIEKLEAEKS